MKFYFILIISVFCTIPLKSQTILPDQIIGDWVSPKRDLIVRCYKENNIYYGKVVWFYKYHDNEPDDPNGVPEVQWLNSVVMNKFLFADNEWAGGEIYDLKSGKKYDSFIQLNNSNSLKVTGYVFFRFLSESTIFTRYQELKLPAFN